MTTLADMVTRVQGHLNQYLINRPMSCTFLDWGLDGSMNIIGVQLADVPTSSSLNNSLIELATGEIVQVSSYDSTNNVATCPAWFRGQLGTPQDDDVESNSRAVIEPLWPVYHVAQTIVDGIRQLYPDLFAVREETLSSSSINGNYLLPNDVENILNVTLEIVGPSARQFQINQWTVDISNDDGLRYLRTNPSYQAGRPIYVTYRAKPVIPDAADLTATWEDTGLPSSAVDLPVLYATYTLLPAVEAAKTQMHSMEQSDRNRLVQSGAATSASRRFEEMYERRRFTERRALLDRFPPRLHRELNG